MATLLQTLMEPCAARIEISERQMALQIAMNEYSIGGQSNKLTIFTDGSECDSGSGLAIIWRNSCVGHKWNEALYMLDSCSCTLAEFFAFSEAMKLAIQQCEEDARILTVIIYTDCTSVLEHIRDFHTRRIDHRSRFPRQLELAQIKTQVKDLQSKGINVVFRWVPAHSQVPGNERADKLAYKAATSVYEYSLLDKLAYPPNGYLEAPSRRREKRISLRQIQHGRIEKIANSRRGLPAKKLYAARIEQAIEDINSAVATTIFDIIDSNIDRQLAKNEAS